MNHAAGLFPGAVLRHRQVLILLLNQALTTCSFFLALALRFDFQLAGKLKAEFVLVPLATLLFARALLYTGYRLNRGYWRYTSVHEGVQLCKAHLLSTLMFAAALGVYRIDGFPRSLPFIEFVLSLVIAGGSRMVVRLWCEYYVSRRVEALLGPSKPVIVVGAGLTGHLLVKTLRGQERSLVNTIAVFDDNEKLQGQSVHGVRVEGPIADIPRFLRKNPRVFAIMVAVSHLSPENERLLAEVSEQSDVTVRRIRAIDDILSKTIGPQPAKSAEELLSRDTTIVHDPLVASAIAGKAVLITGAGGSIGSELVRQVLSYEPASVVLVDKNEFNLYQIEQELVARRLAGRARIECRLADVSDRVRMRQIFTLARPELVFHAAAYKHVPMLESNAHEGFVNNVVGTRRIFELSRESGVERFVLISTDKAVDPSSFMGCTKRLGELMVIAESREDESRSMISTVVRFGNVINSAGSVIPLFTKQIREGRPITVTHEDMERYFMSIREAVRLVLTAGTQGDSGRIYLLDMGKPIKIMDVAKKLRTLYDREELPIVVTGLRPGEKLTETLYSEDEHRVPTNLEKIFAVESRRDFPFDVFSMVDELEEYAERLSNAQLSELLRNLVKGHELETRRMLNESRIPLPGFHGSFDEPYQERAVGE